jgi:hypothetical protein
VRAFVVVLALATLGVGASQASAVVIHLENGATLSYLSAPGSKPGTGVGPFDAFFTNLDYGGGPVMMSNTDYTLYWSPSGSVAYPGDYRSGVNAYFEGLAHDSGGQANVDSVATQYDNAAGTFVRYESKFGGALLDEHPYPANGCKRAPKCLTDEQIRTEIERYVTENHLPTGNSYEYFLLTPEGVESCFEAAGLHCSANATEHREYCAYHGDIHAKGGGDIVYSNDPFVNKKACDESSHHINGTSDSALFGGLSHEHIESVTDPEPNDAWTDWGAFTGEIGDKCRTFSPTTEFGPPLGEVGGLKYNQEINGRRYWYQQEWSNKGHACLQRLNFKESEAPTAKFTTASLSGNTVEFNAAGSTTGASVRYAWQFNDSLGHGESETIETESLTLEHTFPSAETYLAGLTVYKADGTSRGAAQLVTPGKLSQSITFTSSAPGSAIVGATYGVTATGGASGNAVTFTSDAPSAAVCSISGSTVNLIGEGTCTIDANQAGNGTYSPALQLQQSFGVIRKSQIVTFTSVAPGSATVGGPVYNVATAGGSSAIPVTLSIAPGSSAVCTTSGSTVSFVGVGKCVLDANQAGNAEYFPATEVRQEFEVGKGSQTVEFTSLAPTSATVGGTAYSASANASSGLPVALATDASSAGVCTISGATVSFVGLGTCTIDANQAGNANYYPAPQVQQSFAAGAAPLVESPPATAILTQTVPIVSPVLPNSTFVPGETAFNQTTGAFTFHESVGDPGTFSWLLTFQNGKFGVFASSNHKCKARFVRLGGKCRPSRIVFAKGSQVVAAPGTMTFKLKPSASALKALKNALKHKKGLPVTATFTFQSARGGSPVSHTRSLTVKLKKK